MSLPQSFCCAKIQPCRARAPFVRFADIFPANGEICPRQRGPCGGRFVNCPYGFVGASVPNSQKPFPEG